MGLDIRAAFCPDSTNRSTLNGLILYEPTCSKAQDGVLATGRRQSLISRPVETSVRLGPISGDPVIGLEGIALHHGEEDEHSENVEKEDGHILNNRYDDNLYAQSTPIPLSVFGRPLLSGGFSG